MAKFFDEQGHEISLQASTVAPPVNARTMTSKICPRCGRYLVKREARRGPYAGKPFLGCSGYPGCQFLARVVEDASDAASTASMSQAPATVDDVAARFQKAVRKRRAKAW